MAHPIDVDRLETDAYRARYDDGLIDLYVGLSLAFIGACWLWIESLAGLAGVFPAVFMAPFLMWRKSFIEGRTGYVKFGDERRRWERRNLVLLVAVGVIFFMMGIGAYLAFEADGAARDVLDWIAPGLIALLLAVVLAGAGVLTSTWRMLVYASCLVVTGVLAAVIDANPGLPLLVTGIVIAVWGTTMVIRFVRANPGVASA